MDPKVFDVEGADIAWCPGCGDFSILKTIKETLAEMEISPTRTGFCFRNWTSWKIAALY